MTESFAIVTIATGKLSWFDGKNLLTLPLPEAVVSHFEVRDKRELKTLLRKFVAGSEIDAHSLLVIFDSSFVFEKTISALPDQAHRAELFLGSVPLESVLSRAYLVGANLEVSALNRELYEIVREAFKVTGSEIFALLPASRLHAVCAAHDIKDEYVFLIEHSEVLRSLSMISLPSTRLNLREQEKKLSQEHKRSLIVGFAIFVGVLILITGLLLHAEQQSVKSARPIQPKSISSPRTSPKSPVLLTPGEPITKSSLTVQILAGPKSQEIAIQLQTDLMKAGYPRTVIGPSSLTGRTTVTVDPSVPPSVLTDLLAQLKKTVSQPAQLTQTTASGSLVVIDLSI